VSLPLADFFTRIAELDDRVGHGDLTGTVIVDQVYAQYQHEGLNFHHPRGGQALYLQRPLMSNFGRYLEDIAATILDEGPNPAMIRNVEDLAEEGGVATRAPILYDNLRASGHPIVTSDGTVIYDRAPRQHRLSEEELAAIRRAHDPDPAR
jgi:hypothetical protein